MSDERIILAPTAKLVAIPIIAFLVLGGVSTISLLRDRIMGTPRPEVSFAGEGKVIIVPDIALVQLGVSTFRAKTAVEAMKTTTEKSNRITTRVKALGVEEKDVRTSNFNLNPSYDYEEGRQTIRGFDVNTTLEVKIRNLDKIGEIIAAATAEGANQIGGLSFTVDNMEKVKNGAREKAIEAAKEKAIFMSRASGLKLGKLINVSESFAGEPPIYRSYALEAYGAPTAALPAPSIEPGSQEIVVNVTLTYRVR